MTELQFATLYAKCWNNLEFALIEPFLAEDVVYESQEVLTPLIGKAAVSEYLSGKMVSIKKSIVTSDVYAEIGYCGSQKGRGVRLFGSEGRPCVLVAQGDIKTPLALVLLQVTNDEIQRIDICTVVPHPSTAIRTGVYPE